MNDEASPYRGEPRPLRRDTGGPSVAAAAAREEGSPGTAEQQRAIGRLEPFFDGAVLLLYVVIGVLFLGLAVVALGYALVTVPQNIRQGIPTALATLLSEVLLVLILVEVLRTVLTYVTTRTTSIRPFLTVAIISSVRRILAISAELSLVEELSREEFTRAIMELLLDGGIILVVSIALYLISRREGG